MKKDGNFPVHSVDILFTLSLFFVFTVSAFLIVLIGSDVYQSTAVQLEDTYSTRTSAAYVTEKIRQHDSAGCISLTDLDGRPALLLTDNISGTVYETYIYSDGNSIFELMVREGTPVTPHMGQEILKADGFTFTEKPGGFLELSVNDVEGNPHSILFHLRSTERIRQ